MAAIITLLTTLVLSLFVQRIGATALTMTGLSMEAAKFQARSAFCGVGFTTDEAGLITNHPVRRRIVYTLMLLGNVPIALNQLTKSLKIVICSLCRRARHY